MVFTKYLYQVLDVDTYFANKAIINDFITCLDFGDEGEEALIGGKAVDGAGHGRVPFRVREDSMSDHRSLLLEEAVVVVVVVMVLMDNGNDDTRLSRGLQVLS